MSQVDITVDGQALPAAEGAILLWELEKAGLFIPHLCAQQGLDPPRGACRLCWVEVDGRVQTACTVRVVAGMQGVTRSEAVDRLTASAFELLMSRHRLDCRYCAANRRCALQQIAKARRLPLKPKGLPVIVPEAPVDDSRPDLTIDPGKCVLCGHCVYVCQHEVKKSILEFVQRGLHTHVGTFDGRPLANQGCGDCVRCAEVCPVGAIYLTRDLPAAKS